MSSNAALINQDETTYLAKPRTDSTCEAGRPNACRLLVEREEQQGSPHVHLDPLQISLPEFKMHRRCPEHLELDAKILAEMSKDTAGLDWFYRFCLRAMEDRIVTWNSNMRG